MVLTPWSAWVTWLLVIASVLPIGTCRPDEETTDDLVEQVEEQVKPKLLYILLDGFRWDYVDRQRKSDLPGFNRFLKGGVRARWTVPIFPSLSYPSWTTLSTGLYSESHGIVGNYFYDPETKETFSMFDEETTGKAKWWTAEPIWTTAENAGLKTAQYLWSRCDVPINGTVTEKCVPFTFNLRKDNFLRSIMKALENLGKGYDLVQVYTVHIDEMGHEFGPNSPEVREVVREIDGVIDILLDELEDRQWSDKVNVIIVSDHGMADASEGAVIRHHLRDYIDLDLIENIADYGTIMNIKVTDENNVQKVYDQLMPITGAIVYKKEDIPESLHFKNGKYVHDILVIAEPGHLIMGMDSELQIPPPTRELVMGYHGYMTDVSTMRGIFFAKGPAFQEDYTLGAIHLVDIYQVVTNVLELVPQPNNGSWGRVSWAFKPSHRHHQRLNMSSSLGSSLVSFLLTTIAFLLVKCF